MAWRLKLFGDKSVHQFAWCRWGFRLTIALRSFTRKQADIATAKLFFCFPKACNPAMEGARRDASIALFLSIEIGHDFLKAHNGLALILWRGPDP